MEFAPAGVELSFEVTFDSSTLDVAMRVFDYSGASPVQVALTPMVHFFGNSYAARFTGDPGKTYLVHKAVYTDDTYADLDPNYAAGTESVRTDSVASLVLDVPIADHDTMGSVGAAIEAAAGSGGSVPTQLVGFVSSNNLTGHLEEE